MKSRFWKYLINDKETVKEFKSVWNHLTVN